MMQPLHILRKDIRHHWPELAVYVGLLIAFAVEVQKIWATGGRVDAATGIFHALLEVLIPIAWFALITRVVQSDSAVGDHAFWMTRPIGWHSVLIAKLLYVAVCVVLPFMAMQWMLLLVGCLSPTAPLAGMTASLLKFALINWLPMVLFAAITPNLASTFFSILGTLVAWVALLTWGMARVMMHLPPPYFSPVFSVFAVGSMLAVMMYQYAKRRTERSRGVVGALLALSLVIFLGYTTSFVSACMRPLISWHFGPANRNGVHLVFARGVPSLRSARPSMEVTPGYETLRMPLSITGLPSGIHLEDVGVTIDVQSNGMDFHSGWLAANLDESSVMFTVPSRVMRVVGTGAVKLHMELGAQQLEPQTPTTISASSSWTPVPGNGICKLFQGNVLCRFAYSHREPMLLRAEVQSELCTERGSPHFEAANLRGLDAGTRPDPILPMTPTLMGQICPGRKLLFTPFKRSGPLHLTIDIPTIPLDPYILHL